VRRVAADLLAGLQGAVSSVPSGMATAVLAGVQPIQGLYASMAGPTAGSLTAGTRLMIIAPTGAAALGAASALHNVPADKRPDAVAVLTILVAAALVAAGLLRLGRYTRFVSHSVMIGFLTGVSVNIICGQVAGLTGATPHGQINVLKALSVLLHPGRINLASLLTGLAAMAILAVVTRTRLALAGMLLAVIVPTAVVAATGATSVARVRDTGHIKPGIPVPAVPDFRLLSFGMISGALAVAAIILVQGAGVSEVAPSDDVRPQAGNRNLIAQGVANIASSLLRGIPVGGSLGDTSVNVRSGARTRLAGVASGVFMGVILVAFSGAVGLVASPTLAAVLIFFGLGSFQVGEIRTIWRTGPTSQVAIITTFAATLLLPVAAAVGIGVALSLLLQLNRDAMDLSLVELIPLDDGRLAEAPPPEQLPGGRVTILDVYGSLLYAGARTLQARLPDPTADDAAVLVLRLRGRTAAALGATFVKVISDYADALSGHGGRIYLSGLSPDAIERLDAVGLLGGPVQAAEATPVLGESTYEALRDAQDWLVSPARGRSADGRR
jgi:sulfate permease, SulP family